jgi:hypothetical protein
LIGASRVAGGTLRGHGLPVFAIVTFLAALLVPVVAPAQAPAPSAKPLKITVLQVYGEKTGEPQLPKALTAYKKSLAQTGHKRFSLKKKKAVTLKVDQAVKIPLVDKLGTITLTLRKSGKVEIKVLQGKKVKSNISAKLGKHPYIQRDKSLKRNGKELILILQPPPKK